MSHSRREPARRRRTSRRSAPAETVEALASAAGIAGDWWDVSGKRTIVSPETKIALLTALGLEAGSEAQARESLARVSTRRVGGASLFAGAAR